MGTFGPLTWTYPPELGDPAIAVVPGLPPTATGTAVPVDNGGFCIAVVLD